MYFPDGDGVPRRVIMDEIPEDMMGMARGLDDDVLFYLFTRENPDNGQKLIVGDSAILQTTHYNVGRDTKFLVHGFMSSTASETITNMRDAYLKAQDCNVIAVDWSALAASTIYWFSKTNTPVVGSQLGKFILFLVEEGSTLKQMHLVGHSLGAHVVGAAGSSILPRKVAKITGLDPAMPGYQFYENLDGRLDPDDGEFVQVIHTCSGALGYSAAIGHADFYPNGGSPLQPGCCCMPEVVQACSHARSHEYFAESITTEVGFYALPCASWSEFTSGKCKGEEVLMGEHTPPQTRGVYYLATNSSSPFALGPIHQT